MNEGWIIGKNCCFEKTDQKIVRRDKVGGEKLCERRCCRCLQDDDLNREGKRIGGKPSATANLQNLLSLFGA
jgi:hypothetical protein